jgi:hypothetical protein
MPRDGSITLGDIQDQATLAIACDRCGRAGRYPLAPLIVRHGADYVIPDLLRTLSADCPKRHSGPSYDMCGCHCPELPRLFAMPTLV